ncbi:MAG: peptidylprolyl isomerase, partial [Phycisphaerae bacterium]
IRKTVTLEYDGRQRRYEKALEARGQTLDNLRQELRRRVLISSYLESEINSKIHEPTRAELMAAFQATASSLRRPPRRRMSLIDVRIRARLPAGTDNPSGPELEKARTAAHARMEAARAALAAGKAFADVARRFSDGLHAGEGGNWGWVTRGSVRARFEPAVDALYALDEGGISDVLTVDNGLLLVRCDRIDPGLEPDFRTVQPELVARYSRNTFNREVSKLVGDLRGRARIEPANLDRFHAAVVRAGLDIVGPTP